MTLRLGRWLVGLLVLMWLCMPLMAQSDERPLEIGDLVGGSFADNAAAPQEWVFEATTGDIIALDVRRVGGVFVPRVALRAPSGTVLFPTEQNEDAYEHMIIFEDGLPETGTYSVAVAQQSPQSDGVLTRSEYTLYVEDRGQVLDVEAQLAQVPSVLPSELQDFSGEADSTTFPDLTIIGDVTYEQLNVGTQASQYRINGARDVTITNTNEIVRVVDAIVIRDDGIAIRTLSGATIFTDTSIRELTFENSGLFMRLETGEIIRTDFYQVARAVHINGMTEFEMQDGQQLIFDGDELSVRRRGGIMGEGPNVEPVLVIVTDGDVIETDRIGWQQLSVLEGNLKLVYDTGWQFTSENPSGDYFENDGFDINNGIGSQELDFEIDASGLSSVSVRGGALAIEFVDETRYVDDATNVDRVRIANRLTQFLRTDGTTATILADGTRINSAFVASRNPAMLPNQNGFLPQNFNNLGTTVSDYHPHLDTDFAMMPFNRVNGNFVYSVTDYHVPSSALELDWTRTYNSLSPENHTPDYQLEHATYGTFGAHWRHSYQLELDVRNAVTGELILTLADGSMHIFAAVQDNPQRFRSRNLRSWVIERVAGLDSGWVAYPADGHMIYFDAAGRLTRIDNDFGQTLLFNPMPSAQAEAFGAEGGFFITEAYGRRLEIYTDSLQRIIAMRGVQGRVIRYQYDSDGMLDLADYFGTEHVGRYEYSNGSLTAFEDANGSHAKAMAVNYNAQGQVIGYTLYPDAPMAQRNIIAYDNDETIQTWDIEGDTDTAVDSDRSMRWSYDERWLLTQWQLPNPDWVYTFRYVQDTGQLTEVVLPTRAVLRFSFDTFNYLARFTDPQFADTGAYVFTYEVDESSLARRLVQIDSPIAEAWRTYDYDAQSRLIASEALAQGTQRYLEAFEYNLRGELSQIEASGAVDEPTITQYSYDAFGYAESISIAAGESNPTQVWRVIHDGIGQLFQVIDADNQITQFSWDADRGLLQDITIGELQYSYRYDDADNLERITGPGQDDAYIYDAQNRVTSYTDKAGQITSYGYDSAGNVREMMLPDNLTVQFDYDRLGNVTRYTNIGGISTEYDVTLDTTANRFFYTVTNALDEQLETQVDPLGRIRQVADFDRNGNLTFRYNLTYNAYGNLVEINDASSYRAALTYDNAGNVIAARINDLNATQFGYTPNNLLATVTTPIGQSTTFDYDVLGYPRMVTQGTAMRAYDYDRYGNLREATDANGLTYAYTYNALNQVTSARDPLGEVTRYSYDASGNLIGIVSPLGDDAAMTYEYDAADRLTSMTDAEGGITRYEYNESGNLLQVAAPSGLQTDFAYDGSQNIVAVIQPNDRDALYGRDALGRVVSETNPLGQTTVYSYNVIGEIGRVLDPRGSTQSYSWLNDGAISVYQVSNGIEFQYNYDGLRRLTDVFNLGTDEPTAVNTRLEYDAAGNITAVRHGNRSLIGAGDATAYQFAYDADGNVVRYTPPQTTIPYSFIYDAEGQLVRRFDPTGIETVYEYDEAGRVLEVRDNVGTDRETVAQYNYDAVGNIIYADDAQGIVRRYIYDNNNRLIEMTESSTENDIRTYTFAYDAGGRLTQFIDATGLQTHYRYDLFDNLVAIEQVPPDDSDPLTTRYTYNVIDNLTQIQLPDEQVINLTYDGSGQRVRYIDAANNTWSYSYDDVGNLEQVSNPLGNNVAYVYDLSNRLASITYETGGKVDFTYDGLGNLSNVELPDANLARREVINYEFDRAGNVTGYNHAENDIVIQRDAFARVSSILMADGETITIDYDDAGAITSVTTSAGAITRQHDAFGRLAVIEDGTRQLAFDYNAFGQLTDYRVSVVANDGSLQVVSDNRYVYNQAGQVMSRNIEGIGTVNYQYDAFRRLQRADFGEEWVEIAYNGNGWRTSVMRSNGIETRYTYDPTGRVRNVVHLDADENRLDAFAYEYDAAGNVIRITRSDDWSIFYSYDSARQLTSERWLDANSQIVYSVTYSYDLAGNRIEKLESIGGDNQTRTLYTYNNRNQLMTETRNAELDIENRFSLPLIVGLILIALIIWGLRRRTKIMIVLSVMMVPIVVAAWQFQDAPTVNYLYDENGNLAEEIFNEQGRIVYDYDAFNRLMMVRQFDADDVLMNDIQVTYEPLGRVGSISTNEVITQFNYDAKSMVSFTDGETGTTQTQIAITEGDVSLLRIGDDAFWTLDDGVGNAQNFGQSDGMLVTDDAGFHTNAFGEVVFPESTSNPVNLQYLEQFSLADGDIILLGTRAYQTRTGRFLQRDLMRHDPRGNLYTYVYNSPTNFVDPSGMQPENLYGTTDLSAPVVEPDSFIMRPDVPQMPQVPSVATLQANEMHRILSVAAHTEFELNDITLMPSNRACDLYIRLANPADDFETHNNQSARMAMLNRYDGEGGWMPEIAPQVGAGQSPLASLNTVSALLSRSLQGADTFNGCQTALDLPSVDLPMPTTFYHELIQLRQALDAITYYEPTIDYLDALLNILEPPLRIPTIDEVRLSPRIIPLAENEISRLQTNTATLFTEVLSPTIFEESTRWQIGNQGQRIGAPITIDIRD